MNITYLVIVSGLFGLVMGSFGGATVWRLRARQLISDKKAGEQYDKVELKRLLPLTKATVSSDRSRCLHCGHTLAWYDLLPLVSWLSTRGRCRYCKARIGRFEPLIELGTAVLFMGFTHAWLSTFGLHPLSLVLLGLWLAVITLLVILFAYDLKWFLLPDIITFPLIGISVLLTGLTIKVSHTDLLSGALSLTASVAILSGLYLFLWLISSGRWVGFGDVKLGLALGILVIDWKLALLTLFLANLLGTLTVLPGLITGKLTRQTQVPFGPFLIAGFFISVIFGHTMLGLYDQFSTWLSSSLLML